MGLFDKKKDSKDEKATYPADYPKESMAEVERWRKMNESAYSEALIYYLENQKKMAMEHDFYMHDDVYKRGIDILRKTYEKKLENAKEGELVKLQEELEGEMDELLAEAILKRKLLSFKAQEKNYEARKAQFDKLEKAFHPE
jgi:hypothetical protein